MFLEFFTLEVKRGLKRPMVYIFLLIVALLVFGATVSESVRIGGAVGTIHKNAPHIVTIFTGILSIFGLLFGTAFFNNAALRDHEYDFQQILFSTPASKSGYYFGRFFGALVLASIPMIGVFIGSLIGTWVAPLAGWVDAERFGDTYWLNFLSNYLFFVLPNMFFAGAILFPLAAKFKKTTLSFMGALGIIVAYIAAGSFLSDLDNMTLAALTDTFGIRAYSLDAKYFSPLEKNTIGLQASGYFLLNRLIWFAGGAVILVASYFAFSFRDKKTSVKKAKKEETVTTSGKISQKPTFATSFNMMTSWLQFKTFYKTNLMSILKSNVFIIIAGFAITILLTNLIGGFEYFGLQSYPVTYKVIDVINNSSTLFTIIILIFFAGELIWRDRLTKINEVIDATPHGSSLSLIAKSLSLVTITSLVYFFFVIVGILFQLLKGYTTIEPSIYLANYLLEALPFYLVFGLLAIFVQVIVNQRYIAYFVCILILFGNGLLLSALDIGSNMLDIGSGPSVQYSDMSGFGPGLVGALWFNAYWIGFTFVLFLIGGAVWVRGKTFGILQRFASAKDKITKGYWTVFGASFAGWLGIAAFVFYNTQLLNTYKTPEETIDLQVKYEQEYKKYQGIPQPSITDIIFHLDLYPEDRDVKTRSEVRLKNKTAFPIDSLHLTLDEDWDMEVKIPGAEQVFEDKDFGYTIFKLAKALQPGESMDIVVTANSISKGFENRVKQATIVQNGTFINNTDILPRIGYTANFEIGDRNERKKQELPKKDRMPKLEENCTSACMQNYLTNGTADWVNVETYISTTGSQTAIAPGSLLEEWQEEGRNHYHYKVDHKSQNFFSFMSAEFEKATTEWNGIDIEVYYDAKHAVNVETMKQAVQRSLEYYTENFGPYYHKQCRIIEFPRFSSFAQAFPGTMPYSESIGFIINLEDETKNNIVDAVIAHEMAHQWWAHQVIGATMQGGTLLSESFAEYSSLMVMKKALNDDMAMKEFLKYDHERYLRGRSGETEKENPIYKVENQTYIHYGKGSVVLFALQDYIGEDKVNEAMRCFLEQYRYAEPPYPTSLDFLEILEPEVPDSLKYLVDDLFRKITLYDLRMKNSTFSKLENGKFEVTMDIEAYKMYADSIGNETKVDMNDWVDIGFFADEDEEELLFQKRVKINQPEMSFTFVLDKMPKKAAIDPRRILIERVTSDNVKKVKVAGEVEEGE